MAGKRRKDVDYLRKGYEGKKVRILYITQYFHPEVGATTNRALASVRHLSSKGHEVTVLTEMPNHPQGIIFSGYKRKIFVAEKLESFLVKRVWVFTASKKNFLTRILFYLSFAFNALVYTLLNLNRFDCIFLTSPPLFVAIPGIAAKLLSPKKRVIFEVRDLWPDSAIDIGELNNKLMIRMSFGLEKAIYNKADKIIAVNLHQKDAIADKGVSHDKIMIISNSTDPNLMDKTIAKRLDFMESLSQKGKFLIIYAGLLGLVYNFEKLFEAAKVLVTENIHFIITGSGPRESELHELAKKLELTNISFTGEVPTEDFYSYVLSADCSIIPLKKDIKVFKNILPAKFFDYMALGTPILLGIEGEAADILEETGAGLSYSPNDVQDLVNKILYLRDNPEILNEMRGKGKYFILKDYNCSKQSEKLDSLLAEF
jgi:glycosyltransferase involved in cell wall biosynthesis